MDLVRRYANKSYEGTVLTRTLKMARGSVRCDEQSPGRPGRAHKVIHRLSGEDVSRLVEAYRGGVSTTQLGRDFGLGHGTVVRLLQQHEVTTRFKGLDESELAIAQRLYESGLPLATVSKEIGRAQSTVRKALVRAGVRMRARGGRHDQPSARRGT